MLVGRFDIGQVVGLKGPYVAGEKLILQRKIPARDIHEKEGARRQRRKRGHEAPSLDEAQQPLP